VSGRHPKTFTTAEVEVRAGTQAVLVPGAQPPSGHYTLCDCEFRSRLGV